MQTNLKLLNPVKRHATDIATLALLAVLYMPLMIYWIDGWLNKSISIDHEYFSYALLGFPYAALIAWELRHRWFELPDRASFLGLSLVAAAGIFYLSPVQNLMNLSLPLMLSGIVLLSKGMAGFGLMGFPLLFVALATPTALPYLIVPYLLPLQQFIASVVGFLLTQIDMNVTVDQIYVLVNDRLVEVAPYCAGLKMMMTSVYVGLILLHRTGNILSRTKTIMLLVGAAILSVIGNIIRNTLLSYFHGTDNTTMFDWLHESWGGDVFSALLLFGVMLMMKGMDQFADSVKTASTGDRSIPVTF
ncbi:cyanoexosortase B [cf. Phormidesmis sp. LEGE 11477]|uniref:cyanoexosortase B n=1 Tax=cf. Phormidesmis sp. LEGE 11477 TaxID=1828680 RepID=UPI00187E8DAF|nr:cyanoexosortase B [cf. Phormidesmis sp. LEGE 11477]MBE9060270.1 cyanoexosortase B [cf. Phormidesmis sp. LEGE 11477]